MNVGERTIKTSSNPYGWCEHGCLPDDNEPVFFCFAGAGTNTAKEANGTSKIAEMLLGRKNVHACDIHILTAYPKVPGAQTFPFEDQIQEYDEPTLIAPDEVKNPPSIKEFYWGYFAGIVSDGDLRLPESEATRRASKITIFAFSYGAYLAAKIEEQLMEHMELLDYSHDEIRHILSALTIINCAPYIKFNRPRLTTNLIFGNYEDPFFKCHINSNSDNPRKLDLELFEFPLTPDLQGTALRGFATGKMYEHRSKRSLDKTLYSIESEDAHLLTAYTRLGYKTKMPDYSVFYKTVGAEGLTKVMARACQNAVSLSAIGEERTPDLLLSDDVPVVFRQGSKYDNGAYLNIKIGDMVKKAKENGLRYKEAYDTDARNARVALQILNKAKTFREVIAVAKNCGHAV